jgi:fused signal recognition particle receptor
MAQSWSLGRAFQNLFADKTITEETWQELEDTLVLADCGVEWSEDTVSQVRAETERIGTTTADVVRDILRDHIEAELAEKDSTLTLTNRPAVVMIVGVNGVGKTTTIGKFAHYLIRAGRSVMIAAADTFRAAAVDQLAIWADRAGAAITLPERDGQDPASVAFQAVQRAMDEGIDIVLIDTAGRLHTKTGLMDELHKVRRVVEKLQPVSEVLLVLDATTGQNGVAQAQAFLDHAGVTGLVVTKLDGSAKGGFVLGVMNQTDLPVKLIGTGESLDDMAGFSPGQFAKTLLG